MRKTSVVVATLGLCFAVGSALCDDTPREKVVSEEAIRTASARLYSDILFRACLNGKRYTPDQIQKGFNRHASELKLQLAAQGYRIAPEGTAATQSLKSSRMVIATNPGPPAPKFGCLRPYWLDD